MLTPQIYWMPSGFYLLNGLVFFLSGHDSIQVGRLVSFACITAAALILRRVVSLTLSRIDSVWPLLGDTFVIGWYISLPVVLTADIARPDALALLTIIVALDCFLRGRLVAGFAFSAFSLLVHPLLGFPACAVAACMLPALGLKSFERDRIHRWEWIVLAFAAAAIAVEIARLISDFTVYRSHWAFQLSRKEERSVGWTTKTIAALTVTTFCWAFFRSWTERAWTKLFPPAGLQRLLVLVFSFATLLVQQIGQEMWYFPFLLLGLILVLVVALGSPELASRMATSRVVAISMSALSLCAGLSTWSLAFRPRGAFGFHAQRGFLVKVSTSLQFVTDATHASLLHDNASEVLVDPSLYFSFLDSHNPAPQAFTWNPLSRPNSIRFDHIVTMKRGYPSFKTDLPLNLLSGYACLSEKDIRAPSGLYVISITAVAYRSQTESTFVPCSTR